MRCRLVVRRRRVGITGAELDVEFEPVAVGEFPEPLPVEVVQQGAFGGREGMRRRGR